MQLTVLVFVSKEDRGRLKPMDDPHYELKVYSDEDIVGSPGPFVHGLINECKPVAICVVGTTQLGMAPLEMPFEVRRICYWFPDVEAINWDVRESSWYAKTHGHPLDSDHPLISVFTTTYKSGDKIFRPLLSLKQQTYSNWEWIVWDDSDDGYTETWETLQKEAQADSRIRLFKANRHSGFIGEMKRLACGVASGSILVEVDHDDLLHDDLLKWIVLASKKYPDAQFFATDDLELFEEGEAPFSYGDIAGLGYGSNMRRWIRGQWHCTRPVIPPNPITLSYIVGVPNHVRAWKRDFYHRINGHNPQLPVADDYDLLLRTFIHGTPWVHIAEPGYYQFRNNGGNNFTFKRNALIQHLVKNTWKVHAAAVMQKCQALGLLDRDIQHVMPIWHSSDPGYSPTLRVYSPEYDTSKTVSVVIATHNRADKLVRAIWSVIGQTYSDWILYVIGDKCPTLEKTMQGLTNEIPKDVLEKRIRWWNLESNSNDFGATPRNYAVRMHAITDWVCFLDDDNQYTSDHLLTIMECAKAFPHAKYIASNFLVQGREVKVSKPVKGRLDSSNVAHRRELYGRYGYFRRDAGYCADWDLFSRWKDEPFACTGKATMIYDTDSGHQTYDSIARLVMDENHPDFC